MSPACACAWPRRSDRLGFAAAIWRRRSGEFSEARRLIEDRSAENLAARDRLLLVRETSSVYRHLTDIALRRDETAA